MISPPVGRRLVHDDADAALLEPEGGGEPGDPASDDGYRGHADLRAASSAASSSSPWTTEVKAASKGEGAA